MVVPTEVVVVWEEERLMPRDISKLFLSYSASHKTLQVACLHLPATFYLSLFVSCKKSIICLFGRLLFATAIDIVTVMTASHSTPFCKHCHCWTHSIPQPSLAMPLIHLFWAHPALFQLLQVAQWYIPASTSDARHQHHCSALVSLSLLVSSFQTLYKHELTSTMVTGHCFFVLQEGSTWMGPFWGEDDQWLVALGRYKEVCTSITSLPHSSFVSHPLKLTFVSLSCFPNSLHIMDAPPSFQPSAYWLEHLA